MPAKPFLIVTTARSGSNQLVDYVNQLPNAKCFGEVFKWNYPGEWGWKFIPPLFANEEEAKHYHQHDLSEYWDRIVAAASPDKDWIGAKMFYEHRGGDKFWSRLNDDKLTIIHLYRPRVMDLFLSLLRAEATGVWIARDEASLPPDPEIEFPEARYLEYRAYTRSRFAEIRSSLCSKANYWELSYEDISDRSFVAQRLHGIFGSHVDLKNTMLKQSQFNDNRMIKNGEVAARYADDLIA